MEAPKNITLLICAPETKGELPWVHVYLDAEIPSNPEEGPGRFVSSKTVEIKDEREARWVNALGALAACGDAELGCIFAQVAAGAFELGMKYEGNLERARKRKKAKKKSATSKTPRQRRRLLPPET